MPFRPEQSLLRVDLPALHTIDTRSVDDLFGMWSVFSKASHAMEDGRRLENLSWRLWNRETFCCRPDSYPTRERRRPVHPCALPLRPKAESDMPLPQLSTSAASSSDDDNDVDDEKEHSENEVEDENDDDEEEDSDSDDESLDRTATDDALSRPELSRHLLSPESTPLPRETHITPTRLRNMVMSIQETSSLEPTELPLPTLPTDFSQNAQQPALSADQSTETPAHTSEASTPLPTSSHATLLESSASTVDTNDSAKSSHTATSQESSFSSTEMSTHSIVRGFVPGGAPSSYRSQTNLSSQPTPILKNSPRYNAAQPKTKKGPMFTIGTSSGEDESSLDSHMRVPSVPKSELSESLRRSANPRGGLMMKKQTSFLDEVAVARAAPRHSPVFESDDEDEDDDDDGEVSESAIEDDDDSSEWEDSDDNNSGPCSVNERDLFQRVDSRPDLTSRRSLLTTLMHEPDRARALANAASRSTPALRRSRLTSPSGPSLADSSDSSADLQLAGQPNMPQQTQPSHPPSNQPSHPPSQQQQQQPPQGSQPKPIIMTTSNTHQQLALSPRTTRRNMLSTELTESLRKNLLWERQHKSTGNLAALKRRHTAHDIKNLKQHPEATYPTKNSCDARYNNDYFDAGLGEYNARGW